MADANSNILDAIAADPNVSEAFKDGVAANPPVKLAANPARELIRLVKGLEFADLTEGHRRRLMSASEALESSLNLPSTNPRVIDNDRDEITVTLNGKELRGWSYSSEAERRMKMLAAREYVEGYCDGRGA